MQALSGEHHAGLHELLVEGHHLAQQLLARHLAGFALLACLDQDHDSHVVLPPCVGGLLSMRRASRTEIDTGSQISISNVTGPSLTSSTSIIAPMTPSTPQKATSDHRGQPANRRSARWSTATSTARHAPT